MDYEKRWLDTVYQLTEKINARNPLAVIKACYILTRLLHRTKPVVIVGSLQKLMDLMLLILEPNLVEYQRFADVTYQNIETYAVYAVLEFIVFLIFNISPILSQAGSEAMNFNVIYDRFLRMFIENQVDGKICKGITSKGYCVVFGGKCFDYTPSASYFMAIANTVKHLVQFHDYNFNKLSLILRQLILIANSVSLRQEVDIKTDIQVLLSQNPNLGFCILQSFNFIEEIQIGINEDNQQLFKLSGLIQSVQRLLFVQNYIDETKYVVRKFGKSDTSYLHIDDNLAMISRLQFEQYLQDVIDDIRHYLTDWIKSEKLEGSDVFAHFLANYDELPSKELKFYLMNLFKCQPDKLEDSVERLFALAKQYPELSLPIGKALGECRFLTVEAAKLVFLAAKLAFCKARVLSFEYCVYKHFFESAFLYYDIDVLLSIRDLDMSQITDPQVHYIVEMTAQNYRRLIDSGVFHNFDIVYESMRDKYAFLRYFIEAPNMMLMEYLKSCFYASNRDEVWALRYICKKTGDITYMLPILLQNPAYLADATLVNHLTNEYILNFLKLADSLYKKYLENAYNKLREFDKQQQEGVVIDKNNDTRQIKDELQQKIQQTTAHIAQLKKGNCGCLEEGIYWGLTELLSQTRIERYAEILAFLRNAGYMY